MVVDALVYHPSVAHYLRFINTTGMSLLSPADGIVSVTRSTGAGGTSLMLL